MQPLSVVEHLNVIKHDHASTSTRIAWIVHPMIECNPGVIATDKIIDAVGHAREHFAQKILVQPQPFQQLGRVAVKSLVKGFGRDGIQLIVPLEGNTTC
jgi:hypothetical protein